MDLVNVAEKRVECRTAVNNTVHRAMQKLREKLPLSPNTKPE
jgi:DNA-directed RNA polymerase specialized sigma24 family protein